MNFLYVLVVGVAPQLIELASFFFSWTSGTALASRDREKIPWDRFGGVVGIVLDRDGVAHPFIEQSCNFDYALSARLAKGDGVSHAQFERGLNRFAINFDFAAFDRGVGRGTGLEESYRMEPHINANKIHRQRLVISDITELGFVENQWFMNIGEISKIVYFQERHNVVTGREFTV